MIELGWKYVLSFVVLIASFNFAYVTFNPPAYAINGPLTDTTGMPMKSWFTTSSSTFLSTGANETVIITGILQSSSNCNLEINNLQAFRSDWSYARFGSNANQTSATMGTLQMVIEPNSNVKFDGTGCGSGQYVQGFYIHTP